MKSRNLLLSYAEYVYSEDELMEMKTEVKQIDSWLEDNYLINTEGMSSATQNKTIS